MSGYSKTPLFKKLGIIDGSKVSIINPPDDYPSLLGPIWYDIVHTDRDLNFVHMFTNDEKELANQLSKLKEMILPNGMIWISWYKKSSGKQLTVNENLIRSLALSIGMVDVKVCAVTDEWSGLKLMIRRENR